MPRLVTRNGVMHSFPDNAQDDEIDAILGPERLPAAQTEVRKIDNAIIEKAAFSKMLGKEKLRTRDKETYLKLFTPAHTYLEIEREETTPANLKLLDKELETAKPKAKKILLEEREQLVNRLKLFGIK